MMASALTTREISPVCAGAAWTETTAGWSLSWLHPVPARPRTEAIAIAVVKSDILE
jgi:hypothetical protein